MKTKITDRVVRGILIILICLLVIAAQAQEFEALRSYKKDIESVKRDHIGFAVSFGTRSSTLSSNYAAIDDTKVLQEGGAVGFIWGSRAFETEIVIGYYYSAASVTHTTDLIDVRSLTRFYPLRAIKKGGSRVNPFLSAGVTKNYHRLYGYYTKEETTKINYSVSKEPYIGNLNVYNALVGAGVSVSLLNDYDFVKLFASTNYSQPFSMQGSTDFRQTTMSGQLSFNLGVCFGVNRFKIK